VWNHGFNLILLDEKGTPTHYAKCRPASVSETMHEANVLAAFATDPGLAEIIPPTHSASSSTLNVQVSRFIGDRPWDADSIRGNISAWTRAVREILAIVGRLADRALVLLPDQDIQVVAHPGEIVSPLLAALTPIGLPNESLKVLLAAVDLAPAVAACPQHGDLWPANLIERPNGGWWLLDFEMYGRIRMPFHDVFHLAASNALTTGALSALAIYYFAQMTERLYRSGTPQSFWSPYLAELNYAAEHLRQFRTMENLLMGSRHGSDSSPTAELQRDAPRVEGPTSPRRK
jgi:hypothetical protein